MTVVRKKQFKLRDPKTGLFWGVSSAESPKFNTDGRGKHWSSLSAVNRNWADYILHGLINEDGRPDLEVVEYEVVTTMKGVAKKATPPDMSRVAMIGKSKNHKYRYETWAKELTLQGFEFKYIIECWGYTKDMVVPETGWKGKVKTTAHQSYSAHRDKDQHIYFAVPTKADMAFLWVAMGEWIECIWDMKKGEPLFQKEHPPLNADDLKIRR